MTPLHGFHMIPFSGFRLRFFPTTLGLSAHSTRANPGTLLAGGSRVWLPEPMYGGVPCWQEYATRIPGWMRYGSIHRGEQEVVVVPRWRRGRVGAGGAWMFFLQWGI